MAVTAAAFVSRFPEFTDTNDVAPGAIEAALSTAATFVSSTRWGSRYEDAVMYKAAHLLAMSPMGENARLEKGSEKTTYGVVFDSMLRALPVRFLTPGFHRNDY